MINRKRKRIVLLEYKRTSDTSERYYEDMNVTMKITHANLDRTACVTGGARMGGGSDVMLRDRDQSEKRND